MLLTDLATFTERQEAHWDEAPVFNGVFRVRGFCMPSSQGYGVDEGKQLALLILERTLADYRSDSDLTATAFIRLDAGDGLRGAVRDGLAYADSTYYGFEILLPVQERFG